jgi:hypothetical protein
LCRSRSESSNFWNERTARRVVNYRTPLAHPRAVMESPFRWCRAGGAAFFEVLADQLTAPECLRIFSPERRQCAAIWTRLTRVIAEFLLREERRRSRCLGRVAAKPCALLSAGLFVCRLTLRSPALVARTDEHEAIASRGARGQTRHDRRSASRNRARDQLTHVERPESQATLARHCAVSRVDALAGLTDG